MFIFTLSFMVNRLKQGVKRPYNEVFSRFLVNIYAIKVEFGYGNFLVFFARIDLQNLKL